MNKKNWEPKGTSDFLAPILKEVSCFANELAEKRIMSKIDTFCIWSDLSKDKIYNQDETLLKFKILMHGSIDNVKKHWKDDDLCLPYVLFGNHDSYGCHHKKSHNTSSNNHNYTLCEWDSVFGPLDCHSDDNKCDSEELREDKLKLFCYYFVYLQSNSYSLQLQSLGINQVTENILIRLYYCLALIFLSDKKMALFELTCFYVIRLDAPEFDFWQIYTLHSMLLMDICRDNDLRSNTFAKKYLKVALAIAQEDNSNKSQVEYKSGAIAFVYSLLARLFCDKFENYNKGFEYARLACQLNRYDCQSHYYLAKSAFYLKQDKKQVSKYCLRADWLNDNTHWKEVRDKTLTKHCYHPWYLTMKSKQKQFVRLENRNKFFTNINICLRVVFGFFVVISHKAEANIDDYEYFWPHWTIQSTVAWTKLLIKRENNDYNLPLQCEKIIEKTLKSHQNKKNIHFVDEEIVLDIPVALKQQWKDFNKVDSSKNKAIVQCICKGIERLKLQSSNRFK